LPPDEPAAQNPPAAAIIDYMLTQPVSGPVTLDILDANGALVRHYSSDDKPPMSHAEMENTVGVPLYWLRPFQALSAAPGMHRWLWDLHYPTPKTAEYEYPIAAIRHDTPAHPLGPRAGLGQYTVRLTVNGRSYGAPLEVKLDPRITTSQAGIEEQFHAEMNLAAMMDSGFDAAAIATSLRDQLDKLASQPVTASNQAASQAPAAATPIAQDAASLQSKLKLLLEGPPPAPNPGVAVAPPRPATLVRLNAELAALYGAVDNADAAPTDSQSKALAAVKHDFDGVMARWNEFKSADLPAFNNHLHSAGLPLLVLGGTPAAPAESHNQE
jgi:hypothetical protein